MPFTPGDTTRNTKIEDRTHNPPTDQSETSRLDALSILRSSLSDTSPDRNLIRQQLGDGEVVRFCPNVTLVDEQTKHSSPKSEAGAREKQGSRAGVTPIGEKALADNIFDSDTFRTNVKEFFAQAERKGLSPSQAWSAMRDVSSLIDLGQAGTSLAASLTKNLAKPSEVTQVGPDFDLAAAMENVMIRTHPEQYSHSILNAVSRGGSPNGIAAEISTSRLDPKLNFASQIYQHAALTLPDTQIQTPNSNRFSPHPIAIESVIDGTVRIEKP